MNRSLQRFLTGRQGRFYLTQSRKREHWSSSAEVKANALEACEKVTTGKKYIILSGRQKKRFFLINVKNSFAGEVIFDKNTNLPISTKENVSGKLTFLHGIGLSNVKREAAKYLGNMDIKVKRKEFSVTVLLQERSRNE